MCYNKRKIKLNFLWQFIFECHEPTHKPEWEMVVYNLNSELQWKHTIWLITEITYMSRNKQGLKRMLFNRTRQYNIQIFNRYIFVK